MSGYHKPVLLKESIEHLNISPQGIYIDLTFGGGGHSMEILGHLTEGKLFAFDQDEDAEANSARLMSKSFEFVKANFRHFNKYLKAKKVKKVDGILADLGVSSHQIDEAERGFSTRYNAKLDMRMDQSTGITARKILNSYEEEELHRIFGMYGEVKNAKTLANAICIARSNGKISTVEDFKAIALPLAPRGRENKYLAQAFQALRIEVNDELGALKDMLMTSAKMLKPGGRLVVISYHSLEDRLTKNFINKGKFVGEVEKDIYGNELKPFKAVVRKPIEANDEEVMENSRARSAKMRVAERTEYDG